MQYSTKQKIRLVHKISKAKNKVAECLKLEIAISTYYYWRKKYTETASIDNKSRKPKYSPKKTRNKEIINKIKELNKDGRGKYYIKAKLLREGFKVGTSAIVGVLKRAKLWKYKKRKFKKRYNKKFVSKITKAGEIVSLKGLPREDARSQIDTKYLTFNGKKYFQFTAVDLATRFVWRQIYDDRSATNGEAFLKYVLANSTFKIKSVQTDNGTEYTYRLLDTEKESGFDLLCQKLKIESQCRNLSSATPPLLYRHYYAL